MEHTNRLIYLEDDDVATVDATGSMITVHYKTHHTVYIRDHGGLYTITKNIDQKLNQSHDTFITPWQYW